MSDPEIDALAEEACPCVRADDPCRPDETEARKCHACFYRPAVSAAIRKALAANDAEWKARIEAEAKALDDRLPPVDQRTEAQEGKGWGIGALRDYQLAADTISGHASEKYSHASDGSCCRRSLEQIAALAGDGRSDG